MNKVSGTSLEVVLFLIFFVLRATNNIDWPWVWVFAPLWIPLSIVILLSPIDAHKQRNVGGKGIDEAYDETKKREQDETPKAG
jgi:Transmembrane Fragile-X-F protein